MNDEKNTYIMSAHLIDPASISLPATTSIDITPHPQNPSDAAPDQLGMR